MFSNRGMSSKATPGGLRKPLGQRSSSTKEKPTHQDSEIPPQIRGRLENLLTGSPLTVMKDTPTATGMPIYYAAACL